jgi:hypothetical protein
VDRRACKLPDGDFHLVAKAAIAPAVEHESGGSGGIWVQLARPQSGPSSLRSTTG